MFIQQHQLHEILSPKKGCQRGLEEYIVEQHWGDKQVFQGGSDRRPSYMYSNNPIYRVGVEGDPAPNGISSRSIQQLDSIPDLKMNESALHLLHPTIDSGSVFLSEKPWDSNWYYGRENIENVFGDEEAVKRDREQTSVFNDFVERKRTSQQMKSWMDRSLPIYDQQRINDEESPDGVRERTLPSTSDMRGIPMSEEDSTKRQVIENYQGPKVSAGYGAYGYPQPHGYATMGDDYRKYDVFPGVVPGVNVEHFGIAQTNTNLLWIVASMVLVIVLLLIYRK
jgi:hypothetical protein